MQTHRTSPLNQMHRCCFTLIFAKLVKPSLIFRFLGGRSPNRPLRRSAPTAAGRFTSAPRGGRRGALRSGKYRELARPFVRRQPCRAPAGGGRLHADNSDAERSALFFARSRSPRRVVTRDCFQPPSAGAAAWRFLRARSISVISSRHVYCTAAIFIDQPEKHATAHATSIQMQFDTVHGGSGATTCATTTCLRNKTSCCITDSPKPHRYCHLADEFENIDRGQV